MGHPFIVYTKNKTSLKFEYKRDVSSVIRTNDGYRFTFSNGKSYDYGTDKVKYYPLVSKRDDVRIYENGRLNKTYNSVDNYGRYLIFRDGDNCSVPIENNADIEICDTKKNIAQTESVINYFKKILTENDNVSFDIQSEDTDGKTPNQISSDILLKALDRIDTLDSRSVLSKYIDGTNPVIGYPSEILIYPFGCNESQKLAIETTLSNSISIIEGPPGTGKTQTILNIIANLIVQNKTVAIVSNNNSAVFNVLEKLTKYGYRMVAASLGNNENKASFFGSLDEQSVQKGFEISEEKLKNIKNEVLHLDYILTTCFQYRNKLAVLKTELSNAEIEFNHLKIEQPLDQNIKTVLDERFQRKWTSGRILKLKDFLSGIDTEKRLSIINRLRFVFQYGFFDLSNITRYNKELYVYVNHKFYELYIAKIKNEISDI